MSSSDDPVLGARIAFFGWCDGASETPFLAPNVTQRSIKGLSQVIASHIYPLSLRSNIPVFAVYRPSVGESFRLIFRDSNSTEAFFFEFTFGAAERVHADGTTSQVQPGTTLPGWTLHTAPVEASPLVKEPGTYQVFHRTAQGEVHIGEVLFVHIPVAEFTPEDIAAIRSDPFALRIIRIGIDCSICKKSLRAYTGLERNEKLETEGWVRDTNLPDQFRCDCGASSFSLLYLKTGLRGLLRRRSLPVATTDFESIRLYEKTALEEKCREFKKLLEEDGPEERLQDFLEKNLIFFARFNPQRLMTKSPVLSLRKMDFAVLNERKELLLIEIENSSTRLLKKDGGIAAELQHAADQVREWLQAFIDHRAAALACLNLKLEDVAKVTGVVIAGRTPTEDAEARSLRSVRWIDIEFYTFDDMLSAAVEIIRHINK